MAKKILSDLNCNGNKIKEACLGLVQSAGVPANAEYGMLYFDLTKGCICFCSYDEDDQLYGEPIPFSYEMPNKSAHSFNIVSGQSSYTVHLYKVITYAGVKDVQLSTIDYSTGIQNIINPKDYDIEFQLNNSDASQVTATITFSTIPNAVSCHLDILY